jgi:hypothetical protein
VVLSFILRNVNFFIQAFLAQFEKSQSIYENVLALSALGNAGIDTSIGRLEQIIKEGREQRVVRVKAIDALRRLRTQRPRQIQQILLPIYQNTREQTEVRTAAFALLMDTLPGHHVIDQCAFTMGQDPNKQVQAFAYWTMCVMADCPIPAHSQMFVDLFSHKLNRTANLAEFYRKFYFLFKDKK